MAGAALPHKCVPSFFSCSVIDAHYSLSLLPCPSFRQLYVNEPFSHAYPGQPVHKWEHVERISATLLRKLDLLMAAGIAAYGGVLWKSPPIGVNRPHRLAWGI